MFDTGTHRLAPFGEQPKKLMSTEVVVPLMIVAEDYPALCDILVVEDDRGIRGMIVEALGDEGYRVMSAAHGRDALMVLEAEGLPRLILLDIMMPVMDGNALYRHLQADARLRDIPVVAMSAAHNLQLLNGSRQVVGLLPKPFVLSQLLQIVEDELGLPL